MENTTRHSLFSKLMSFLFISIGIFLGIFAFFVDATTRTVGSTLSWNNANTYLNNDFWTANPSDYDIITALYGTGDTGSIYTQNWTGYTSGSCLSGGMNVIYTGAIPASITANTVYVIASGTYELSSSISMESCSALISSGTVTLSGDLGGSHIINSESENNIIIEKIRIRGNNGIGDGIQLYDSTNFFINETKTFNNNNGLSLPNSSYGMIRNFESYGNNYGLLLYSSNNIYTNTTSAHENNLGISIQEGSRSITLINTDSYNNTTFGIQIYSGSNDISITTGNTYNNEVGIQLYTASNVTMNHIESYDNLEHNIFLQNTTSSLFDNIITNGSETAMGIYLTQSSGNTFSGITTYGNYYAGVHLYNSDYNLWTNVISNSNLGGLYFENSSNNTFNQSIINNSPNNGVVFSGSANNILSGLVSSGNMGRGIYMQLSTNNILTNFYINNNSSGGIGILSSDNNIINNNTINNNTGGGIVIQYSSGTNINNSNIYSNTDDGIIIGYSTGIFMNNLFVTNNYNGIDIVYSNFNTISGASLSGNTNIGTYIYYGSDNTITNSNNYSSVGGSAIESNGLSLRNSFISFSGNTVINIIGGPERLYTYFDTYTKINNSIWGRFYPYATFTGISPIGYIFNFDFDFFNVQYNTGYLNLSGTDAFTVYGDDRDGIIYSPTPINSIPKICSIGETGTEGLISIYDTMEIISGSSYLTMSGGIGYIKYYIYSGFSGQHMNILKSINGNTWNLNSDDSCILDQTLACNFTTEGNIKLFAFGMPGLYFTGATQSGTIITSGGFYSTGVRITYTGTYISGANLNEIPYTNDTLITGNGTYTFLLEDLNYNTTGITFTIDTTVPVFTGTTLSGTHITSGGYYNTGVVITFADTNISGAILSGLNSSYMSGNFVSGGAISSTGRYLFRVYDRAGNSTGMIFTIDTSSPTVTGTYPTSGLIISGTNDIVFSWSGTDDVAIDTYTLYVTGPQTTSGTTTGSSSTVSLINGSYTRYVVIRDRAGNTGTSQIYPFSIVAPFTGGISLTGPDTKQIGSYRYSKNLANIYMRSNEAVTYTISGNITGTPLTGNISSWLIYSPTLTGSDGRKDISVSITNGTSSGTISKNFIVRLDTVAIAPTLNTPVSGSTVAGDFLLTWSSPYPDSAGISGYEYYLSLTPTFATLVASGSTSSLVNSAAISGLYFGESNTSLYRYAKTIDKLGNFGTSAIQSFVYSGGVWDTTPSAFSFTDVTNANRNTTYLSNTLTITGITAGASILASIDRGALYISGDFVGTTGYMQNGRTVQVELISSDEYDTTVSSTLSIGGVSDTFSITTEEEDDSTIDDYEDIETDLSTAEKLRVIAIFESLKDLYAGSKEEEFFNTFMVVLQDKIDTYDENDEEYDSLVYLYDLIERYYDGGDFDSNDDINYTRRIINGVYTAPNGKKYTITYDSSKQRFTSTNFVVPKYFPTLDSLKHIIDINNPVGSQYANAKTILARRKRAAIDGTRQSSPYTAPNKKVYYFFKDITGRYSSYTFTSERRFDSLDKIKEYIYNNNR